MQYFGIGNCLRYREYILHETHGLLTIFLIIQHFILYPDPRSNFYSVDSVYTYPEPRFTRTLAPVAGLVQITRDNLYLVV